MFFFLLDLESVYKNLFNPPSTISPFIWVQDWVKTGFQIEELTLVQNLMENRLRHARGLAEFTESVT